MNTIPGLSIKLVNIAHFAVANAKSSSKIVSAAKNVTQLLAFAALVVANCAFTANAGLQRCFRILCGEQFTITKCSKNFERATFWSTRRRSSP
jgi:hypothetical protein